MVTRSECRRQVTMLLTLLLLLASAHAIDRVDTTSDPYRFKPVDGSEPLELWSRASDPGASCAHRRIDLVRETLRWLDTNDDACVDLDEMHEAFNACLSWYERWGMSAGSLFGAVQTPESTMARCDRNSDSRMCIDDLLVTERECEEDRERDDGCLCTCSPIEQLFTFVLDREPC